MKVKNATFVFSQDITDVSVGNFIANLVNWSQSHEGDPLQVILNSGGGGVLAAIALYEFLGELRENGHTITIKVMGRAGSAAAIVLQAADERVIAPNSDLLIHAVIPISQPAGTVEAQVRAELDRSSSLTDRTFGILSRRSGGKLALKTINSKTCGRSRDWWVNAKQCLACGLVDRIEKPRPAGSVAQTESSSDDQES